ncbi:MAG: hypothetical protein EBT62_10045, partial [Opitutaceae bacterium]|nr:hypothetical protein [Opitutaceae bacterium]
MLCSPRLLPILLLSLPLLSGATTPDPTPARVVDLRFGMPTWHQPLGAPDDWHKPMADERGALLYDFGPGPYVQPATIIAAGAVGDAFKLKEQTW